MDADAFDHLYRTWYVPLWRFARTLVRSDVEAQDIVHDIFLKIWDTESLQFTASPQAYLFRAVRNGALDWAKRHGVAERFALATERGEPMPSPEAAVELRDTEDRLAHAIQALPERQRSAILLRWHYELNAAEIGRVMEISDTAARKLLGAAERKLSLLLD